MSESITNLDMNFSNGGAGHTATVRSVLNSKNPDGSDSLGFVDGGLGEEGSFSRAELGEAMNQFRLTEKVTNRDPSKTVITRKYTDVTSLKIDSYVVLVRGVNASPIGLEYPPEGEEAFGEAAAVPYYGEVTNSPAFTFGAPPALVHRNTIIAGKIYNQEATSQFNGVKMTLVYQNEKLVKDLSLNDEYVNPAYLASPDYAQYNLKFGYTFNEFKQMCGMVGVQVRWPHFSGASKVLFDTSGPLRGVISSIASYFGFYHFINPLDGAIEFIDSNLAARMTINNPTTNPSENVVNASFSESFLNQTVVNTYVGTAEKPEATETTASNDPNNVKLVPSFFKRVKLGDVMYIAGFGDPAQKWAEKELGAYFELWNSGFADERFDRWTWLLLILSERLKITMNKIGRQAACKPKNGKTNWREWLPNTGKASWVGGPLNLKGMNNQLYEPVPSFCGGSLLEYTTFATKQGVWSTKAEATNAKNLGQKFARVKNGKSNGIYFRCQWRNLAAMPNATDGFSTPMPRPSASALKSLLEGYFSIAGGVYVSNVYHEFKANRMEFKNTGPLNVCGPFFADSRVSDHAELGNLTLFFDALGVNPTIDDLAKMTNGFARNAVPQGVRGKHFIGLRDLPKVNLGKFNRGLIKRCDFSHLDKMEQIKRMPILYIGGPKDDMWGFNHGPSGQIMKYIKVQLRRSQLLWKQVMSEVRGQKDTLKMIYDRSKTEANEYDGEEEDNKISEYDGTNQELAELFDRFDLKNYKLDTIDHSLFTQPTLSAASGSTTEMAALRSTEASAREQTSTPLKTSQKTIYGLSVPQKLKEGQKKKKGVDYFDATTSSLAFSVGEGGIQTTIGESTLKIMQPNQQFLQAQGMSVIMAEHVLPKLNAAQRNYLGL